MHIGIIIAMEEELASISNAVPLTQVKQIFPIYKARQKNLELSVIISKIGKAAAASATTYLIEKYNPDLIINIGSCGGLNKAKLASIIVSDVAAYHDVDVTGFGYKLGQLPGQNETFTANKNTYNCTDLHQYLKKDYPILDGTVITGDQFVNSQEDILAIKSIYPNTVAIDMEAAAIAQICNLYNKDFLLVKKVSDLADSNATSSFKEEIQKMNEKMPLLITKILEYFQK